MMMRTLTMTLAVVLGLVALPAAATPIIDNNHIYCWGDSFGDQFDNYAEVERGDTIVLQVWVNDLDGSVDTETDEVLVNQDGARQANGVWTCTWWDPFVIDWTTVHEHRAGTYYSGRWPNTTHNDHGENYWYRYFHEQYSSHSIVAVEEGRSVINLCYTIRNDAPLGPTTLGLQVAFRIEFYGMDTGYFFGNRIENDQGDPYAMTLNVVPEPATVGLLGVGGLALVKRRRGQWHR